MTILILCLFIAVLIPYLSKLPLGYAMKKTGYYDNHHPRTQAASLEGFGARAFAAHQNSFEALNVFAIAVLLALITQHTSYTMQMLAILFIISRVVYHVLYLMDKATLRSLVWFVGFLCCLTMIGISMG